jgi:hypothetical protein
MGTAQGGAEEVEQMTTKDYTLLRRTTYYWYVRRSLLLKARTVPESDAQPANWHHMGQGVP